MNLGNNLFDRTIRQNSFDEPLPVGWKNSLRPRRIDLHSFH